MTILFSFFRTSLDPQERNVYQNSPFFGVNLGVDNPVNGFVHLNDEVYVIQNRSWQKNTGKWIPISLITLFIMYRAIRRLI